MMYVLGIDVSKGYIDLALLNSDEQDVCKSFIIDDTHSGHKELESIVLDALKDSTDKKILKRIIIKKFFPFQLYYSK